jgi:hypothetical protein
LKQEKLFYGENQQKAHLIVKPGAKLIAEGTPLKTDSFYK